MVFKRWRDTTKEKHGKYPGQNRAVKLLEFKEGIPLGKDGWGDASRVIPPQLDCISMFKKQWGKIISIGGNSELETYMERQQ